MLQEHSERRERSRDKSLIKLIKRCTKKLIKLPQTTYKKVKKGVKYVAKKTIHIFKRGKKDKIRPTRNPCMQPIAEAIEPTKPIAEEMASSVVVSAEPPKKQHIQSLKKKDVVPEVVQKIDINQSKINTLFVINEICEYIQEIENIVKNTKVSKIDAEVPLLIFKYMRKSGLTISKEAQIIERKYYEKFFKWKAQRNTEEMRRMSSNANTRNCILEELKPTLYLKYLFAKNPLFRKSYTSLYTSLQGELTIRTPGATHSVEDALLYSAAVKQVKLHILEKTDKLERARPVYSMCSYNRDNMH